MSAKMPIFAYQPVKLITGFIFKEEAALKKAKKILEKRFGGADFESRDLAFIYTDHYEKEFGKNLKRRFISFQKLISIQSLPKIKIITNLIEKKLSSNGLRLINIDPGYLNLAKLVLATTKHYNHRIYLNRGIFAEITLFYQGQTFKPWEWTYPDYQSPQYLEIFNRIREIYAQQIKNK